MPILLCIVIVFTLWLAYELNKSTKGCNDTLDTFLKREHDSLFVRKKDMSDLELIKLPNNLPFVDTSDEEIIKLQKNIREYTNLPIANLTGYSNTDLRIKYGAPNLDYLMECDNNFLKLVVLLNKWSSYLYEQGQFNSAKIVLEFCVAIHADISSVYTTLASIYILEHVPEKIDGLINVASTLNTLSRDSIVNKLHKLNSNISY